MILAMTDFSREREAMIERQLKHRGITEPMILDAFREVPREAFIAGGAGFGVDGRFASLLGADAWASNARTAASLLADTQLGSKEEADTVVGMAPGFKSCFPAGREVRIDATEVRMALAEALYHTARARPPES